MESCSNFSYPETRESSHGMPALHSWRRQGKLSYSIKKSEKQCEIKQQCTGLCENLRDTDPTTTLRNLQPLFCFTSSASLFFWTMNKQQEKSVPQFWRTYIQKDEQYINNNDAPHSHSVSCLASVYDTPCMYSVLPHLEGTCFPLSILNPKLCFLTMCATSGCNPASQSKVTICLTILLWRHSAYTEGRFHSIHVVLSRDQPPGLNWLQHSMQNSTDGG